jgi:polysaccharide deacetylase family protein (PEP-CTERM system associated)
VKTGAPQNALSFDVEDYFQVAALASAVDRKSWDAQPARVDANTARLLDLLARRGVRATFFVLGWIAERHPNIVRDIAAAGHEIACHGYSHELIYRQSPDVFRQETGARSASSRPVADAHPLDAATLVHTRQSLWALDILLEQGFEYDSSIFPTHHDLYGIPEAPRVPHRLALPGGGTLLEFPPSTVRLGSWNLPVAGGGYFRLLPLAVTRWAIRRVNREGLPFLFYLHPWEIDPGQPRLKVGLKSRFRHYTNIASCERKLDALLGEFPMGPVWDALQAPAIPVAEPLGYLQAVTAHGAGASS